MTDPILLWLLEGDPAVKWQVQRDLLNKPSSVYEKTRNLMRKRGWAKQFQDKQDENGSWPGLYNPKYISPFYILLLFKRLGYPNGAPELQSALSSIIPDKKTSDGGISYKWDRSAGCVTGMFLTIVSYFQYSHDFGEGIIEYYDTMRLPDGGWNCRYPREKTIHSSFNTTFSALEGLHEYSKITGDSYSDLIEPAQEFFLNHRLYQSHRTGRQAHHDFAITTFPQRWKYNFLAGLDYFREVGFGYDERLEAAIALLHKRENNGYWNKGKPLDGQEFFILEEDGQRSRISTLKALRVLNWFETIRP